MPVLTVIKMEEHQSPCKTFNKRKSLACYHLKFDLSSKRFVHKEIFRVVNQTKREYYILPKETLQKKTNRHISYHKSGAFHWREADGKRIEPVEGEADARRALLITQATDHVHGGLDGYCIAKGRGLTEESMKVMLEILDGYIIPPLSEIGVLDTLLEKKNHSIFMLETPYRSRVNQLIQKEQKEGRVTYVDSVEMTSKMKEQFPNAEIYIDSRPEGYAIYSNDTTFKMIEIARELVIEKLEHKPDSFWTKENEL